MRGKDLVSVVGMMLALATAGQTEFTVSAELSRSSFLPGEPITVVVTVTNATGAKVSLCGSTPQEGFRVRARLKSGDGQTFNCGYGSGGLLVSQDPEERPPRSELAPGQCLKMSSDLDLAHCPLSMFRPGPYEIDVAIEKAPSRHSEPWVALVPVVKTIEITAPQGEDAAYLRALEEAIASADPKTLKGGTLQSRPLEWGEVLHTRRANAEAISLQRFPTSTYAGYFLGLGEGFPMILDSKPEYVVKTLWEENYLEGHPLATLKTEAVQGGGQKPGMRTVAMRGYLEEQRGKIDKYLAVHPDHARREIMELARAYQSLALRDKDTAVRSLEWVAGQAPSEKWRDQAQAILDAMKRKGWVKE